MQSTPDLVRCPVCGSRKINSVRVVGITEMICYCRDEGTVMESVNTRVSSLSDPDADHYTLDDQQSHSESTESQVDAPSLNPIDDNGEDESSEVGSAQEPKDKGFRSLLSRLRLWW